jgi:hypothetical protein
VGEPQTPVEVAADHALEVFSAEVELLGEDVEVEQAFLLAHVKGVEHSGVVAGQGSDDPVDVFKFLLTAATGVGRSLGFEITVIDVDSN